MAILEKYKVKSFFYKIFFMLLFILFFPKPTFAYLELVKTKNSPTVYYIDETGMRHAFPDFTTYQSWHGNDFSRVVTLSSEYIADLPLGKNITHRPGKYLVKIPTSSKVYSVEQGGILRHINTSEIAEALYGKDWAKKIVDIQEIFFNDYIVGKPINRLSEIPNNIIYKIKGKEPLYWKINDIIQQFTNIQTLMVNGYTLNDIVEGERNYFERKRPIQGVNKNIFNPVALPIKNNNDCESKNLSVAFLYVVQNNLLDQDLEKIDTIRKALPERYSWATQELSELKIDRTVTILPDDGYFTESGQEIKKLTHEVFLSFYDSHKDIFDFLIIFTNFASLPKETFATFTAVANRISGTRKILFDVSETYGSSGKLKGIINMGNLDNYGTSSSEELNRVLGYILHEILHNWAASINFIDADGNENYDLLNPKDRNHWSDYVSWISPAGGMGWTKNADDIFTSGLSLLNDANLRQFASIDLYLMGLLPSQAILPLKYIAPENTLLVSSTIHGTQKTVTIDQIIEGNGKWYCNLVE